MTLFLLSLIIGIFFFASKNKVGFHQALATWFPIVFLLIPVWISMSFSALLIDCRMVFFLMAMALFTMEPPGKKTAGVAIADALAFALSASIIFSQFRQGQMGLVSGPEILRRWFFPYLLGRWVFSNWRNLGLSASGFATVILISTFFAVLEALLKFNLIQKITGKSFSLLEQGEGYRWGIKRAMGSLGHPIFFGMALVCCLPWSILTANRAQAGQINKSWFYLPFAHLGTIIITASRGPQLAALIVVASIPFFRYKNSRVWIVGFALLTLFCGYIFREEALEFLGTAAGEKSSAESRSIMIDGEPYEYTGTAHRLLLFKVYDRALDRVGLHGYGTNFLAGMERAGLGLPEDLEMRFGSIDNGYLLLLLQYGWLSVWMFAAFASVVIYHGIYLGMRMQGPMGVFAGTMGVSLLSVMIFLTSVWFCPDYSAFWLFNAGLIVSMAQFPAGPTNNQETRTIGVRGQKQQRVPGLNQQPPPPLVQEARPMGSWLQNKSKKTPKGEKKEWQKPNKETPVGWMTSGAKKPATEERHHKDGAQTTNSFRGPPPIHSGTSEIRDLDKTVDYTPEEEKEKINKVSLTLLSELWGAKKKNSPPEPESKKADIANDQIVKNSPDQIPPLNPNARPVAQFPFATSPSGVTSNPKEDILTQSNEIESISKRENLPFNPVTALIPFVKAPCPFEPFPLKNKDVEGDVFLSNHPPKIDKQ